KLGRARAARPLRQMRVAGGELAHRTQTGAAAQAIDELDETGASAGIAETRLLSGEEITRHRLDHHGFDAEAGIDGGEFLVEKAQQMAGIERGRAGADGDALGRGIDAEESKHEP